MLENELNDTEPNGEERSGARSPEIDTAAAPAAAGSAPAEDPPAGDEQAPAAKGRRRAPQRPAAAKARGKGAAKGRGKAAAPPDAAPPDAAPPDAASPGPDAAGPSAIRFSGPATGAPAAGAPAVGAAPGTSAPAGSGQPPAGGGTVGAAERSAIPAATFQPPQVIFQPPPEGKKGAAGKTESVGKTGAAGKTGSAGGDEAGGAADAGQQPSEQDNGEADGQGRRRRRRGGRSRGHGADAEAAAADPGEQADGSGRQEAAGNGSGRAADANGADSAEAGDAEAGDDESASRRRRRRRRRSTSPDADQAGPDDPANTVVHVRPGRSADEQAGEVQPVRGSTRLEAKRQRRREGRDSGRRRPPIITESEFLARREAVDRIMVVRQRGERTQIGVLEDGVLVEHYVDKASHQSFVGNVYLGKVQNVLPSMEAAFVDIGKGRNAVLYAGEVNFDASGLEGESKRIESALKSGQSVLVQVTKDPVGHKGARLTSQVSLPGRYLVYVPGGSMMGISRKLPDKERTRLKQILKQVMPEGAGVIVRTAAEGASEEELAHDVSRLSAQWESIESKAKSASAPELLYSEPDLTIRVVRDIFNEDFSKLVVSGEDGWDMVDEYVRYVAPHLADRLEHWQDDDDAFVHYRVDEQLSKALDRKVWLPSGGSLVIDNTEAMTVVDVNTGKFTGQGGNLEETVTRNNLEAAEEIVRQLRLRDVGGIIVIDFIDMVLESNRELVLRRLLECLARDRTKHQVAEVTSLGLVQMTRKRVGSGLLEAFSEPCECCNGRGVIVSLDLVDKPSGGRGRGDGRAAKEGRQSKDGKTGKTGRNGKTSGRPAPASVPAAAADDGDQGGEGGPAPDETGADAAGDGGPGSDGGGPDGAGAPRQSGGRRRRRAATREQGPPEPVGQQPDAGLPDAGLPDAEPSAAPEPTTQALSFQLPGIPAPSADAPGVPEPGVPAPGIPAPDADALGVPEPGVPAPGIPAPDADALGVPEPDVPAPGIPAPGADAPGIPAPNADAPGIPEPGIPGPDADTPGFPASGILTPDAYVPDIPAPGLGALDGEVTGTPVTGSPVGEGPPTQPAAD